MKKKIGILILLLTAAIHSFTQQINYAEYFIDTDPGYGNANSVSLSEGTDITVDFTADLSSIPTGFHILFVRARDEFGKWSQVFIKQFMKYAENATLPNITKLEYFIDIDPGYGNAVEVPVMTGPDQDISFVADLSVISDGFHVLYLRAQDAEGKWSQVFIKQFMKYTNNTTLSDITKLEYFIDTDPGYGNAVDVSVETGPDQDISFVADLSVISDGFHVLYLRAQDAEGKWSQVLNRQFTKWTASELADIVQLEYFVDTDPGYGNATQAEVADPATDVDLDYVVDLSAYSLGTVHNLYVRAKDADNKWGLLYIQEFEIKEFFINANTNPVDSGIITGIGGYNSGETAELSVTPGYGYNFFNWTEDAVVVSTDPTYSFTVSDDRTLTANLEPLSFNITASVYPDGTGNISGTGAYDYGQIAELTTTPETGYNFINWTEEADTVSTDPVYSFTVTEDRELVANFEIQTFLITASVDPPGSGTITGTGTYEYGQTAELSATPETGYDFVNWTEDDIIVSSDATYSFTVSDDRILEANFELQTFEIAVIVNPTGSGTISGAGTYGYGDIAELTATPEPGYDFVNWTEDDIEVSTDQMYSFTVTQNRNLTANFTSSISIQMISNNDLFLLYPNPTNHFINIQFPNSFSESNQYIEISLTELVGKEKKLKTIYKDTDLIQINVSDLEPGFYCLHLVINNNMIKTFKLMITN